MKLVDFRRAPAGLAGIATYYSINASQVIAEVGKSAGSADARA